VKGGWNNPYKLPTERRLADSDIIGSSERFRCPALQYNKSPNGTHSKDPDELNIGLCLFRVSRLVSDGEWNWLY
jgi:hypothetical protein